MSMARQKQPISIAEYLDGELVSPCKHEYADGVVYAMAGATANQNRIANIATGALYGQL